MGNPWGRYGKPDSEKSQVIEKAVENVLNLGFRTNDIAKPQDKKVSCTEMSELIINQIADIFEKI